MTRIYDIAIIGAGIHGAACAQAAAAGNYSVVVLEQFEQPGMVTSSQSSKLIHGGLRYLESAQFKLVFECLRERRYLLKNAPQLVSLEKFYIPVYQQSRRRPWKIFLGLLIYYLLGGKGFKIIARKNWSQLDGLKTRQLQAVFQYVDGKTNDQLLTRSVMASALSMGASLISRAKFLSSSYNNSLHTIRYETEQSHQLQARVIINASGPWVNQCLQKIQPAVKGLDIEWVLGSHIVIDVSLKQGMYYLESPTDGRAVFVMPWQGKTLIGTTEVSFSGRLENIRAPESDIDYLLDVYRHYFRQPVDRSHVLQSFAGCRVLPMAGGSAFQRSRDTIIFQGPNTVFSIYGGKLTAHRATADNVIKLVSNCLPSRPAIADTRFLRLPDISASP